MPIATAEQRRWLKLGDDDGQDVDDEKQLLLSASRSRPPSSLFLCPKLAGIPRGAIGVVLS
jgi:hypothetical protein